MHRRLLLPLFLMILFLVAIAAPASSDTSASSGDKLVDGYLSVIDSLYNTDKALNENIRYIAVDTSGIINLDREAKANLLRAMRKYGCRVLEDSYEGLLKKGYIEPMSFPDGILFRLQDSPEADGVISVKARKWRGGVAAVGSTYDLEEKDGNWVITKIYDGFIS